MVDHVSAVIETESTKSFTFFQIVTDPQEGRATRFAKSDILPRLDDGERHPASDFPEARFKLEVPIKDQSDFFSYSITLTPKTAVQPTQP